jgi:hypothetical protein
MNEHFDIRCSGCLSVELIENSPITKCAVLYEKDNRMCPCAQCIIKMMCENPCEDFEKWDIFLNGGGTEVFDVRVS